MVAVDGVLLLFEIFHMVYAEIDQRKTNERHLLEFKEYLKNVENILGNVKPRVKESLQAETLRQMKELTRSVLDMLQSSDESSLGAKFRKWVYNPLVGRAAKVKECVLETQSALIAKMQALNLDINVNYNNQMMQQLLVLQNQQDPDNAW